MKKLLIVGAGGHGRCCLDIARECKGYDEITFLDDCKTIVNGYRVIGKTDELSSFYPEYTDIVIAIGNNEIRKRVLLQAKEIGYHLISLISLRAVVSEFAQVGEGSVIFPNAVIEANSKIGIGSIISANTTIHHDAKLEDFVLVYSNTVIRPETYIGCMTTIGSNATIRIGTKLKANTKISDGSCVEADDEYAFEMGV